jgi:hypothetical protein
LSRQGDGGPFLNNRFYRRWCDVKDLISFEVKLKESDLFILADKNLKRKAYKSLEKHRTTIENYILKNPHFKITLQPFPLLPQQPMIIKKMVEATRKFNIGPMASVAGTIAEFVGNELMKYTNEVIIENGGDVFIKTNRSRKVGIYSGDTPFGKEVILEINPNETPLGISTSSSTVGESLSYGKADAVTVIAKSATISDAAATAMCNLFKDEADIERIIELAKSTPEIKGIVVIKKGKMWLWGNIRLAHKSHS